MNATSTRRRYRLLPALIAGSLIVSGCAGSTDTSKSVRDGGAPQPGGTLRVVRAESFDGWDPDKSSAYISYQTTQAVLEPMVRFGSEAVLTAPRHPYTAALIASVPSLVKVGQPLAGIGGTPPDPRHFPAGCRFAPRCAHALDSCGAASQDLIWSGERATACIRSGVLDKAAP
jgi:oligopeptide/dipeptide ABC transporter ATP-binding protein